ncbi:MAG: molybdopterin-guanine dinucleotide biosynthesis protein MobB [Candidatus Cloacimonetes bacterium]|nr:molybdopterin-guanine dinucleotide biosynthesis protein MobB [Candidatus Cloacimonadota bacterium]
MKAISVCGYHHTGKTTVCETIIWGLKQRGFSVCSIKDIHNEEFTMEKAGSNSDRHYIAGAEPVIARGLNETNLLWRRQLNFLEMLPHLHADWLIVEGMHSLAMPRIICGDDKKKIAEKIDETVFAVSGKFADDHDKYEEIPVISAMKDADSLLELVLEKGFDVLPQADPKCCGHCGMSCREFTGAVLRNERLRDDCVTENLGTVRYWLDDEEQKIVPFVQNIFYDLIKGFVRNLKGYKAGKVRIEINTDGK